METLPELAKSVEVAALVPPGIVYDALSQSSVRVYAGGPSSRIDFAYRRRIRDVISEFRPDVVSAHLLSAAMHTRSLRRSVIASSRLVVTLHNSMLQYLETTTGATKVRALVNTALERLQRHLRWHLSVAVSQYEYNEISSLRLRGSVVLIPNPLPALYQPSVLSKRDARIRLGLPLEKPIYAFVGRLEFEKGADMIDDIAACLDPGAVVVCYGAGTVRPANPRVTVAGHTRDLASVWAAVDAVMVPSRVESFGRVALEAVAAGVPVVHTGVGGLAELLSPVAGILGYQVDLDPGSFARTLAVAGQREVSEDRSMAARRYQEMYAFTAHAKRWLGFLKSVDTH